MADTPQFPPLEFMKTPDGKVWLNVQDIAAALHNAQKLEYAFAVFHHSTVKKQLDVVVSFGVAANTLLNPGLEAATKEWTFQPDPNRN